MGLLKLTAVAGVLALGATQAMAWGDMYMGDDGAHNPNSMPVQAYHGPNYCPAGLQPVVLGGVVCCGAPDVQAQPMSKMKASHGH